jgi:hypothetical protein
MHFHSIFVSFFTVKKVSSHYGDASKQNYLEATITGAGSTFQQRCIK